MESNDLSYIKKAGETDSVSKEEFEHRILEIAKCKRDICYFAQKYFRIINLDSGLSLIKLYPKQEELLRFFTREKRCITLASRQTGKCIFQDSIIHIKNKKTGQIEEITIEDFFNRIKNQKI